jgi:hypothetical protein
MVICYSLLVEGLIDIEHIIAEKIPRINLELTAKNSIWILWKRDP